MNSNVPMGANNDPRAPWNQSDPDPIKMKVTVSITLSKTFEIDVIDYECEEEVDEDGMRWTNFITKDCDLKQAVEAQIVLPHQLSKFMKEHNLDNDANRSILQDCENWNVDDFEVIEE